jgi:hypothetical protein
MDQEPSGKEKQVLNLLWAEINRAILNSSTVRDSLLALQESGMIRQVRDYNLVVDMEKLISMTVEHEARQKNPTSDGSPTAGPFFPEAEQEMPFLPAHELHMENADIGAPLTAPVAERVDGKPLSPNESRFMRFLESRFDETDWLKRIGLRF